MTVQAVHSNVAPLTPVLEFLRVLWNLNHQLEIRSSEMLRTIGVTAQQRMVLRVIGHVGPVSAGVLARILHVHPGTLSAALRRLEQRGLVVRRRAGEDARRVIVALTPPGEQMAGTAEGTVEQAVDTVIFGADPASVAATLEILGRVAAHLESSARARDETLRSDAGVTEQDLTG